MRCGWSKPFAVSISYSDEYQYNHDLHPLLSNGSNQCWWYTLKQLVLHNFQGYSSLWRLASTDSVCIQYIPAILHLACEAVILRWHVLRQDRTDTRDYCIQNRLGLRKLLTFTKYQWEFTSGDMSTKPTLNYGRRFVEWAVGKIATKYKQREERWVRHISYADIFSGIERIQSTDNSVEKPKCVGQALSQSATTSLLANFLSFAGLQRTNGNCTFRQ